MTYQITYLPQHFRVLRPLLFDVGVDAVEDVVHPHEDGAPVRVGARREVGAAAARKPLLDGALSKQKSSRTTV